MRSLQGTTTEHYSYYRRKRLLITPYFGMF